jgi:broad specificity phosphatase PhoE
VGFQQIEALVSFFRGMPVVAIASSPLLRARQTAHRIALMVDHHQVSRSSLLSEVHSPYDGRPLQYLESKNWDLYSGIQPTYEQPADILHRSCKFIHRSLKRHRGGNIIAVTHADVIVFLTLWAKGYPVDFHHKSMIERQIIPIKFPAPASVTTLRWNNASETPAFSYYESEADY